MSYYLSTYIGFIFACAVAALFVKACTYLKIPGVVGAVSAGAVLGPYAFNLLDTNQVTQLSWVGEAMLGVIAFSAGSELRLKLLGDNWKTVLGVSASMVGIGGGICVLGVYFTLHYFPLFEGMTSRVHFSAAMLGGIVLLALSPASTLAVIKQASASGPVSSALLLITVVMDVFVVILFAASVAIAGAVLTGAALNAIVIAAVFGEVVLGIMTGFAIGGLMNFLSRYIRSVWGIGLILMSASIVTFEAASYILAQSKKANMLEIHLEPILILLCAGFLIANLKSSNSRILNALHRLIIPCSMVFFLFLGLTIKFEAMQAAFGASVFLFISRLLALRIAVSVVSKVGEVPPNFARYAWMGLVTQAGIALGLAHEVGVEFPQLGDTFVTLLIAVIMLNELIGPLLLQRALNQTGESK